MRTSKKGIELLKRFEGFMPEAYRCPAGVLTIGYGHTSGVREGDRVTEEEAEKLLRSDLMDAEEDVERLVRVPLTQNQFDALVSFVYNVGMGSFFSSTLLKKINNDPNDPTIPDEFRKWVKAAGETLPGLVKRRDAEAKMYAGL